MSPKAKEFYDANKLSPVVSAAWLDSDKRPARGGFDTRIYHRLVLEDGKVFTLDNWDMASFSKRFTPKWKGIDP
jgi:hypothetical protein